MPTILDDRCNHFHVSYSKISIFLKYVKEEKKNIIHFVFKSAYRQENMGVVFLHYFLHFLIENDEIYLKVYKGRQP